MNKLNPLESIIYFQNNTPSFLSDDEEIKAITSEIRTSLENENAPNYHSDVLLKGKQLIKRLITQAIDYLSNETGSPVNKAKKSIEEYIDTFTIFEEMLFGLDSRYRDHTLHSLWVYLFGHQFIMCMGGYECIQLAGQTNIAYFNREGKIQFILAAEKIRGSKEHLEAMWAMIAILHDLGYPVERISNQPQEVFGRILAPFAIEFNSASETNLSARISFFYQNICDLLSTRYRPIGLSSKELQKCYEQSQDSMNPMTFLHAATISRDEALEMDFRIASVNKNHSAWSAILAFKNINYLHESDYSGGGDRDYKYLLTKRDILNSIVHHTIEEPKDEAVNRFQFILLIIDDIEEAARYSRGGQERGLVSDYCDLYWEVTDKKAIFKLDYTNYNHKAEIKYEEIAEKYKAQILRKDVQPKYEINLIFTGRDFDRDVVLTMVRDV